MIKRNKELSLLADKEYIKAENKAYNILIENGYTPQGTTPSFKEVVLFKIENQNRNNEQKEVFYFNDWQSAVEKLCI